MRWASVNDDDSFRDFENLYLSAFPPDERREISDQRYLIENRENYFCEAAYDGDAFIGFICWWRLSDFFFIEHMAVSTNIRGLGLGGAMMNEFMSRAAMPVILEVEADVASVDSLRRIDFYKKLGFVLNKIDYLQPAYSKDKKPVRMHIMSYPDAITASNFEKIREDIYRTVYNQ